MHKKNYNEYRLEIGKTIIGLVCPSKDHVGALEEYFNIKNSDRESDIRLNLILEDHNEPLEIPDSLMREKKVIGNAFSIMDLVRGKIDPDKKNINLHVKAGLTDGPVTRVFEQLLFQAFYSACALLNHNSLLVHSSGVIRGNDGFLFVGPSGSGKSTIAEMSGGFKVLNDEICLLDRGNHGIILSSTPFNGYFRTKTTASAQLRAIFLLSHGKENSLGETKQSLAVQTLAKEIVPPIALDEELTGDTFLHMIDLADEICKKVPVKKLAFRPDQSFWDDIAKEFPPQ